MEYRKLQEALASLARSNYKKEGPLSDRAIDAFMKVPRHQFVRRFRHFGDDDWQVFDAQSGAQHLPGIYQDSPIVIWGGKAEFESTHGQRQVSTISQPSFVLRMLDLLDIHKGHRVFELGTASGWNAALISQMTGPTGSVVTAEIITELAHESRERLKTLGFQNVTVIAGDAAHGDPTQPFDRAMFTAGAFDFPKVFFDQIKFDGVVLFVLKNKGGTDSLHVLVKRADHFESIYNQACGFVPVTGLSHIPEMEAKDLREFLRSVSLAETPVSSSKFWWGAEGKGYFIWQTSVLRGYLSLFPQFQAFQSADAGGFFGWFDGPSRSLAVARPGELLGYGGSAAPAQLIEKIKAWVDLGMPALGNMKLRIYPSSAEVAVSGLRIWVSRRPQSTFVWELATD